MSRSSTVSQRSLTLTEELEKLEQSITLTLQEIDHNFSRAHRIVTSSILPVVEKYAEHSKDVWESTKFWKQFFEASANVSLSGYEEPPAEDETITEDTTNSVAPSTPAYDQNYSVNSGYAPNHADAGSSPLSSTPTQRTPRPLTTQAGPPMVADYPSPYETLRREIQGTSDPSTSELPSTPRQNFSLTTESSPFLPPSTARRRTPNNDVLLHRVLDRNWRIQATPHTQPRYRLGKETPQPSARKNTGRTAPVDDESPDSSPAVPAPGLNREIFSSPQRRTPGVSVLTPARKHDASVRKTERGYSKAREDIWDSDSDEEGEGMMSPPKTMQFHVPQSRLLRTPAREASKRIVEDLLMSAGGNMSDSAEEESPSVIRRTGLLEDDTF